MDKDLEIQVAEINQSVKSAHKRLDHLEELTDEIHNIATSTKLLAQTVARQQQDIDKINNNLATINNKPIKKYDNIVNQIITFFIGTILTIVAVKIGLK